MYLTTTVSVTLVLFLLGIECVLLLGAGELVQRIRENVDLTVVLRSDADSTANNRLQRMLQVAPYSREVEYISAQQALDDHISQMGEDPTQYLGYNPLTDSYVVKLNAEYVQPDSIKAILHSLNSFDFVSQVIYPEDVVSVLDSNVNQYSAIILAIAAILLFVAISLITNTIRLQVYSRRFLINTMKLVGAKSWTIKGPIVRRNILIGIIAAVLALALIVAMLYYAQRNYMLQIVTPTWQNVAILSGTLITAGILITLVSSIIATNRYIRMTTNDLYYV